MQSTYGPHDVCLQSQSSPSLAKHRKDVMYPTQPAQGYPPAQPGYPPPQGYGQPPYAPAQPGYPPQQGYGPPQGYSAPPQGYGPPQIPQPPVERVGLADFYDQPATADGASLGKFFKGLPGQSITVQIARALSDADVRPQTKPGPGREIARFPDGRVKTVLVIPVRVNTPVFPDGKAAWWVQGQARDELNRAMREAGVPDGQVKLGPEAGAMVTITLAGKRDNPGFQPSNVWQVVYYRPEGAANGTAPPPAQAANGQPQYTEPPWTQGADGRLTQYPQQGLPPGYPAQPQPAPYGQPAPMQYAQDQAVAAQVAAQQQGSPPGYPAQPQPVPYGQPPGMMSPGAQVAAATQAGITAAQGYPQPAPQGPPAQAPQQPLPVAAPPGMPPDRAALLATLAGQPAPPQQP